MNIRETIVLTYNLFSTYTVLLFTDENDVKIYRMPIRVSDSREAVTFASVKILNM